MRRWIALLLPLFLAGGYGCASTPLPVGPPAGSGTLTLEIDGFRSDAGQALVSLFAGPAGYPAGTENVRLISLPIRAGRASAVFAGIPWGEYAVSVLHDENGNNRMERSLLGIPREGHGASNNPREKFGPPEYADARIVFFAPQRTLPIHMQYFQRLRQPPEN